MSTRLFILPYRDVQAGVYEGTAADWIVPEDAPAAEIVRVAEVSAWAPMMKVYVGNATNPVWVLLESYWNAVKDFDEEQYTVICDNPRCQLKDDCICRLLATEKDAYA